MDMFQPSLSPRIKKVLTKVASGTIPPNLITVSLDENRKRVYTITYPRKDEFGDTIDQATIVITNTLLKKMRDAVQDEYAAATAEFDENIALLNQAVSVFRET